MRSLTVGSLFSGIGGFDLGLERAGMRVIWQSEIDPYASAVLRKHWPAIPNYGDIKTITRSSDVERPDVLCGGFPCQPFSRASAGRARGVHDNRHLWPEMFRLVSCFRPTWVIGENVTSLDGVALETIYLDLESAGYQVATLEIPACAVGLDHVRARLWILGHSDSSGQSERTKHAKTPGLSWFGSEPQCVGISNGISGRVDPHRRSRLRCLGNAVVPQIPELIGKAIIEISA